MTSSVATDAAGNVYLAGDFAGDVNFNPAGSPVVLTSSPGTSDIGFVAKYNPDGTLAWARGGVDWSVPYDPHLAVDAAGEVYLGGSVTNTRFYGPSGAPVTHTALGREDAYVMKLDAGGNLSWMKFMAGAGTGLDRVTALTTDVSGNVIAVGLFQQTDTFGNTTLTPKGIQDEFVARIDSTSGDVTWVGQLGGSGYDEATPTAVALDDTGAAYVTGYFSGTVDFNPGPGTYSLYSGGRRAQPASSTFVLKLDAANNFNWAGVFQSGRGGQGGERIAVDANHDVYVAGSFGGGTVDFDPGKGKYSLSSADMVADGFLCKLSPAGQFGWVESWVDQNYGPITGLAIDGAGNIYLSGGFSGTEDFDPGSGTAAVTAKGAADSYVLKLDAGGHFVWVADLGGGSGVPSSFGFAVDGSGDIYIAGYFGQTVNFDPNGTDMLTSAGTWDVFLVKLRQ
jgi:hypothetical protein